MACKTLIMTLRWHCRQKVVHTKSLVVFHNDMVERPLFELERVASFAGIDIKGQGGKIKKLVLEQQQQQQDRNEGENSLLSPWPKEWNHESELLAALLVAFEDEMKLSENQKAWPCGEVTADGSAFSSLLAPDCSKANVHGKCTISLDRGGEHLE
jgi:hypothetical protein